MNCRRCGEPGHTQRTCLNAPLKRGPFGHLPRGLKTPRNPQPEPPLPYTIAADGKSIRCNICGRTSYNLNDVRERYCGNCHVFHNDPR
jgi:ribosomal protein L37E